ncbi:hypothetical protein [Nocardia abscessus]|uniref:hypothetical protein n=1 Tax=Nocardia abscessus TaxID=120957 RepID=UPI002454BD85|nr:hypothetical protein [Nocardia abscessus]
MRSQVRSPLYQPLWPILIIALDVVGDLVRLDLEPRAHRALGGPHRRDRGGAANRPYSFAK